jgi:AcrR family transcriptional regulator
MTTKEKIVETAKELFNQHGVEAVTVRHIAKELAISHGNLCYHFPRKEDIIVALYNRVVEGMSEQIALWKPDKISLAMVLEAMRVSFALQYDYKFLMVDFVNIMRRIPEIQEHFRQIFVLRKQQFAAVLKLLQQHGTLRKDISDEQYEYLTSITYIIGDFWMSEGEILYMGREEDKLMFYSKLACSLLVPYLTKRELREYTAYIDTAFGAVPA